MLAAPGGEWWRDVTCQVSHKLGIRINCYIVGPAGLYDIGAFAEANGLGAGGGVLVRPDGYVAFRRPALPAHKSPKIPGVLAKI